MLNGNNCYEFVKASHINWVMFGRQKNWNHVHRGEGSSSSHVSECLYLSRETARHFGDKLQGSGLVVELARVRSIMDILRSSSGGLQPTLSFWDVPQGKIEV